MEIHKNTNKQLNDLLSEARHEKPVMNIKEVENIISEGKYIPSGGSRGIHIGMNNLIVVCGIVVSSFLAYMALKVDQGDLVSVQPPAGSETVQVPPVYQSAENTAIETSQPVVQTDQSKSDKPSRNVQPVFNASTLTASADIDLVAVAAENETEEMVAPAIALPSVEYVMTFNYNGQDIWMKMVGEEISEFSVDGSPVSPDQYSDFDDILAEGKNYIIGKTHDEEGSSSLNLIKYFDGQLRSDKILDREVQYKFELSYSQLIVNGNVQSDEMFKKYKGLYEAKIGKTITDGSVYKFERGVKSE